MVKIDNNVIEMWFAKKSNLQNVNYTWKNLVFLFELNLCKALVPQKLSISTSA